MDFLALLQYILHNQMHSLAEFNFRYFITVQAEPTNVI